MSHHETPMYEVYALKYGHHTFYPSYMFFWMGNPPLAADQSLMPNAYYMYLIKGPDVNILFDAGCMPEAAQAHQMEGYEDHATLLGRLGLGAKDIDALILSHLDWDHVDGISFFDDDLPEVYVHQDTFTWHLQVGRRYELLRNFHMPSRQEVDKALRVMDAGKLNLLKGEHGDRIEIRPGLSVIRTDGHYQGHLALVVETAKGPVFLAADSVYLYANLEMGWPIGLVRTSLTDALDVFDMIKEATANGGFAVPGHDPQLQEKFPKVRDGVFRIA